MHGHCDFYLKDHQCHLAAWSTNETAQVYIDGMVITTPYYYNPQIFIKICCDSDKV